MSCTVHHHNTKKRPSKSTNQTKRPLLNKTWKSPSSIHSFYRQPVVASLQSCHSVNPRAQEACLCPCISLNNESVLSIQRHATPLRPTERNDTSQPHQPRDYCQHPRPILEPHIYSCTHAHSMHAWRHTSHARTKIRLCYFPLVKGFSTQP